MSFYLARATIPYDAIYSANGATGGTVPATQSKTYGVGLTLATNSGTLEKTGATFSGWNTAANGSGTAHAAGATYATNVPTTLYAQWVNDGSVTGGGASVASDDGESGRCGAGSGLALVLGSLLLSLFVALGSRKRL